MRRELRNGMTRVDGSPLEVLLLAPLVDLCAPGGDSVHVAKEATLLASKHGCSVTIVSKRSKEDFNIGGRIVTIKVPRVFLLSIGIAFLKVLLASRHRTYDVILERGWYLSAGLVLSRMLRIPLAIELNGFTFEYYAFRSRVHRLLAGIVEAAESLVYRSADVIIATSSSLMNVAERRLKIPKSRIVLIHSGADVVPCMPAGGNWDKSRVEFCFVGSFERWQGLDVILEAFSLSPLLRARALVCMVGDGLLMPDVRRTIAEKGLGACVRLVGRVSHDQAIEAIGRADACLAPLDKRKCGPSLKLFEYMSMGKPVIASRTSDHLFVEEEGIGLLFEAGDAKDLARCLEEFIDKRELYAARAKEGIRLVREKYNWETTVNMLYRTLSELSRKAPTRK